MSTQPMLPEMMDSEKKEERVKRIRREKVNAFGVHLGEFAEQLEGINKTVGCLGKDLEALGDQTELMSDENLEILHGSMEMIEDLHLCHLGLSDVEKLSALARRLLNGT